MIEPTERLQKKEDRKMDQNMFSKNDL